VRVSSLPTAATILEALRRPPEPQSGTRQGREPAQLMDAVLALHHNNAEQWDREDDARTGQGDAAVAAAKRDIDQLNSARHGYIEAVDRAIALAVDGRDDAALVTESPGMAIDRLSVLVIRLASTEARVASGAADAKLYAERLPRLRGQLHALEEAIATLLADLATGTRRFIAYESLKLYGPEEPGRPG
jgi:Protein of unknown function (DUF4254)